MKHVTSTNMIKYPSSRKYGYGNALRKLPNGVGVPMMRLFRAPNMSHNPRHLVNTVRAQSRCVLKGSH